MTLPFYRNPDLADGFGATAGRSQPHRGLDFPHATGTPIPSVNAGVVVVSEWSSVLGWVVEVRGDDGVYLGYCHMNTQGLAVGTRVAVGSIIGPVGNTGSASFGSHLHITKGDRQGAVFGASMSYLSNPWPYIQAGGSITNPTIEGIKMPALIRLPNGSIGFVSDSGELDSIGDLNEVESLKATIVPQGWIQLNDTLIWDKLASRTARLRAARAA
ncbi:M23 family metallopeptidase [Leucobacter sp. UT-8R-CII-1-4]|uniref:M23 family metallopeptidase n=1 Tax=Leucobacter sp. UT-8R-CII-1-4 TaxID=3040075 RepID=UPI0024A833E9|nr:M23 family metallopeptidase [Leucobacter sp. UT-8R-CII-1-4]MDI6023629.1 M23 family metallopeptidase [Leucobacter sp. UT-8R-CII-1-4]